MSNIIELIKNHTRDDGLCLKCLHALDFRDYETINGVDYIIWKCPRCEELSKSRIEE